jgi:hypothetical protein
VRAVAGQSFDYVENDTVELAGNGFDLILPQRPLVVDVSHPVTVTERRYGTIFSPTLLEGYTTGGSVGCCGGITGRGLTRCG